MFGRRHWMLPALAAAAMLQGCSRDPDLPSHDDARDVLRLALAFRGGELAAWRDACVVTRLRRTRVELGERVSRLDTIPHTWLPAGVRATERADGCDRTLVYSAPRFVNVGYTQGDVAVVTIEGICKGDCASHGSIGYHRPEGAAEWTLLDYAETGIVL